MRLFKAIILQFAASNTLSGHAERRAGRLDFVAAREGLSPTRAVTKSRGDGHAAVTAPCFPK
jgi:hypothetical protein